jgi:sulfite reductase (ferredoxin)
LKTEAGECAVVVIDLVTTLLVETGEKLRWAREALAAHRCADAIYHSYNVFINGAKALLLTREIIVNTQIGILKDFAKHYGNESQFQYPQGFLEFVLRINKNEPDNVFARQYLSDAEQFFEAVRVSAATYQEPVSNLI